MYSDLVQSQLGKQNTTLNSIQCCYGDLVQTHRVFWHEILLCKVFFFPLTLLELFSLFIIDNRSTNTSHTLEKLDSAALAAAVAIPE